MSDKKYQPKYVQADRVDGRLIAKGELKTGLTIGNVVHRPFVLREALAKDLIAAEVEADVQKSVTFSASLLAVQLVSLGEFVGPFSTSMLGLLSQRDFRILREAQAELEIVGELE